MPTLIPALSTCLPRMTSGEKRLGERLEQKLDDDYLVWYDVAVGPQRRYPDFVVLHPRRGVLVLETKDWRLETIREAGRQAWVLATSDDGRPKTVINPLEQARHCAIQVVNALERDVQLVQPAGPHRGKLAFPWGYGVVFTRITRKQFEAAGLGEAIAPHFVICQDEMLESVEPEAFQQRLWQMFPQAFGGVMTLPQLDRVRWIMFPEVRVPPSPAQAGLFDDQEDPAAQLPSVMRVMDIQQEQLARSLGAGHRVIHGVAGSGKTMILGYRAEYLAKAMAGTEGAKPILVLCFNKPLAAQLEAGFTAKGLGEKVHARNFHKWCRDQLVAFGQGVPAQGPRMFDEMVEWVIRAVERQQIPGGQYQAVLIDEGHDFKPEWLKLVTQMVDPATNSLLVLYDDAQSIYERRSSTRPFSFKSVGIQAQGRTTILKINYRNTKQVLQVAHLIAGDLLKPEDQDEDGVPLLRPISAGRDGEPPLIIHLPTLRDEAYKLAELLNAAHQEGHAWAEMAVLCRDYATMDECAAALKHKGLPHQKRSSRSSYDPAADQVKIMTMAASKGLEFSVVALPGIGAMPAQGEDAREEARLFYVAATRATQRLIITASGELQEASFARKLEVAG